MYLDVKVGLLNKFWARRLADTVAMWLKCNSTPPSKWIVGKQEVTHALFVRGINVAAAKQFTHSIPWQCCRGVMTGAPGPFETVG
jgi:hypothetical protein